MSNHPVLQKNLSVCKGDGTNQNEGEIVMDLSYLTGFASHFETEALLGALPKGQNSPKDGPLKLYPEQLNGSAFTMKRSENLRSWLYRKQPSAVHEPFSPYVQKNWTSTQVASAIPPNQMRWQPQPQPSKDCDFIDGVTSMVTTVKEGCAVHNYQCNQSMKDKFFYNADGELLIIPQEGSLLVKTEMGFLFVEPLEILCVPRGIKFQIELSNEGKWAKGYIGENNGRPFVLPDLGPLGANALANPRDFQYPTAHFEKKSSACSIVAKFNNNFWQAKQSHNPLDVVAWHGNYAPYKYDLRKFNTMGTVSYDHPDPSVYTVLTSPSEVPGQANADFVIFPPRWLVGENTFRPPYYHRNMMSEYMGLIKGDYDAKEGGGFIPGGSSLHNCMSAHGPDSETFKKAVSGSEEPKKIDNTMAFMFESCHIFQPTAFALNTPSLDKDYWQCWQGLENHFKE